MEENSIILEVSNKGEIGKLYLKDGKLHFTGDVDKSAQIFIDEVNRLLGIKEIK